uniref:Uncharacterized protein n=1 Tax=Davidia involucrata TaxID=16924 RepID=A0A5B7AKS3_DAVIN
MGLAVRGGSRNLRGSDRSSGFGTSVQVDLVLIGQAEPVATSMILGTSNWYRKWMLKDFLLFRSAFEGRATGKDSLKKYTSKKISDDVKNSSFSSTDCVSSVSSSRRRGLILVHESHYHYTENREISEEMKKKKTFLPYHKGLLDNIFFSKFFLFFSCLLL